MTNPTPRDSAQLPQSPDFEAARRRLPRHLLESGQDYEQWEWFWNEALRAQAASVPAPFTFSPMWLAPLDGSPVMLYLPTTTDKFAVGIWHDGHGGGWGDDEGNYYVHEPVAFCSLANLERFTIRPAPQPQAVAASSPATAVDARMHQDIIKDWHDKAKSMGFDGVADALCALQASRQPVTQQAVAEGAEDEVAALRTHIALLKTVNEHLLEELAKAQKIGGN